MERNIDGGQIWRITCGYGGIGWRELRSKAFGKGAIEKRTREDGEADKQARGSEETDVGEDGSGRPGVACRCPAPILAKILADENYSSFGRWRRSRLLMADGIRFTTGLRGVVWNTRGGGERGECVEWRCGRAYEYKTTTGGSFKGGK